MDGEVTAAILLYFLVIAAGRIRSQSNYEWNVRNRVRGSDLQSLPNVVMDRIKDGEFIPIPGGPSYSNTPGASVASLPGCPVSSPGASLQSIQATTPLYTPPSAPPIDESPGADPAAAVVQTLPPSTVQHLSSLPAGNPKKGFVAGSADPVASAKVASLNCGWYYTWGPTPASSPPAAPFTPMIWNIAKTKNIPTVVAALKSNSPADILLGFNEPDGTNASAQGNMTVGDAIMNWPLLVGTGRQLGAPVMYGSMIHPPKTQSPNNIPAPTGVSGPVTVNIANAGLPPNTVALDPSIWIDNFLIQLSQTTKPVFPSFMTIHWYGPPNPSSFLNYIDAVWNKYNLPLWITEYSCADWDATCCPNQHVAGFDWSLPTASNMSTNATAQFMQQTVTGMMARHYVSRFSWKERFLLAAPGPSAASPDYPIGSVIPDSVMAPSNPDVMNQSALFVSYLHFPTTVPELTPLGKLYASL